MALRDFYPFNAFVISPADEQSEPLHPASESPLQHSLDVIGEPTTPASVAMTLQTLAKEMEQARQGLQALLITYPSAVKLLITHLANPAINGSDFSACRITQTLDDDIVQDNHFVQPVMQMIVGIDELEITPDRAIVVYRDDQLDQVRLLPTLLIRVVEQLTNRHAAPSLSDSSASKLISASRRLQLLRQQMITSNTGLVNYVAYKYKASSLGFDDLVQEGIVGLIRAVDRFDPNRGIRFSTYGIFWIKQAISRLIIKQEKVVRLPVALAEKAAVVYEIMRDSYLQNNRWPSFTELQNRCNLPADEIKIICNHYQATHSLDASLSEENDGHSLMDNLHQQQFALPLNELINKSLSLYLTKVVDTLPEKEAAILNMRFGLKNHTEMTLQAIADQLHITRERVRQIQNQALQKINQQFGDDLLPFLEPNDS